ncbi:MAG: IclR family transcriptional regulator [Candidatus Bipolaricaulaceae bacterium]|nr:IclR family transcriptional regulator [Candidatus Bipolaricaulota bacterium]MCX7843770.1 IclR family transcriptional regulator [Candidatus Bipolaricaulota bacterium]MDW8151352.1 IclR family transcriptional regulator [Candidatus Bipolaricaulota bacterium]
MEKERYLNTSLAKALRVFELFNGVEGGLSLSEIASRMGARPGSIYPIVYTLQKFGYLERDAETKKYRLGLRILALANQILSSLDVREKAKPVLKRLARELEVNAHLAVLYEGEVLYLDREEAAPSVVIPSVIGRRVPPHCTALGKVLLAYSPEALEGFLAKGSLPALTPNTITNPELLRRELERVRQQGYAIDWEEFHEGNICVAAPVRNYRGKVVAAISVSLAKVRLTHTPLDSFVQAVTKGAQEVSLEMGYRS